MQAVSQQTPSTQKVLAHSLPLAHVVPFGSVVAWQAPETQACPALQAFAHVPQCALLPVVLVSQPLPGSPSQSAYPTAQEGAHAPPEHAVVPFALVHAVAHPPQWATSVWVSTQLAPHVTAGGTQGAVPEDEALEALEDDVLDEVEVGAPPVPELEAPEDDATDDVEVAVPPVPPPAPELDETVVLPLPLDVVVAPPAPPVDVALDEAEPPPCPEEAIGPGDPQWISPTTSISTAPVAPVRRPTTPRSSDLIASLLRLRTVRRATLEWRKRPAPRRPLAPPRARRSHHERNAGAEGGGW